MSTPASCPRRCSTGSSERAGIDPALVDDVIWGCVMQVGEQALDIARTAVLAAGWPETVPGVTVDRQCGSSQQSVHFAAAGVVAGHYDVVVAGGVESMSRIPMGASLANGGHPYPEAFRGPLQRDPEPGHRRRDDRRAVGLRPHRARRVLARSHEKAAAAQDAGAFDDQIVAIKDQDGTRCSRTRASAAAPPSRRWRPQAGVQGGRRDPRGQRVADLRRFGRAAVHVGGEGEVVGPQATCQGAHRGAGRRRSR